MWRFKKEKEGNLSQVPYFVSAVIIFLDYHFFSIGRSGTHLLVDFIYVPYQLKALSKRTLRSTMTLRP